MGTWIKRVSSGAALVLGALALVLVWSSSRGANEPTGTEEPASETKTPLAPAQPPREALRYAGKSFDQWCEELRTELKPEARVEAIRALGAFATNGYAAEATKALLESMSGSGRVALTNIDSDLTNQTLPETDRDEIRVLQAGLRLIDRVRTASVPVLTESLSDPHGATRAFALHALGELKEKARPALPHIIKAIGDPSPIVQQEAIRVACDVGTLEAKGLVPALTKAAEKGPADIRSLAVSQLCEGRRWSGKLLPAYAEALTTALLDALKQKRDKAERADIVWWLGRRGLHTPRTLPALLAILNDPRQQDDWEATLEALGSIGPEAEAALPVLRRLRKDSDERIGKKAESAISAIAGQRPSGGPLSDALRELTPVAAPAAASASDK
jgi:HEAT repeat protein